MRHSDIRLTMQTYTDPKLLDVRGALAALPALPVGAGPDAGEAVMTGTDASALAPTLAPNWCKRATSLTKADKTNSDPRAIRPGAIVALTADPDKSKEPLTIAVSGSHMSGRLDSNQRPPEPHSRSQGRSQPPNITNASLLVTYRFHRSHVLRGFQRKINELSTFSSLFPAQP
jgi:hypothetical protein